MKVLIGLDDSEQAQDVVRSVLESVWPRETRFLVVSASPPIFLGDGDVCPPDRLADLLREEEARYGENAHRAATRLRAAGYHAQGRTLRGHAGSVLVKLARETLADLVVVGSHGRTGIKKLMLGSVASHVVDYAPCNVLVVKEPVPAEDAVDGTVTAGARIGSELVIDGGYTAK